MTITQEIIDNLDHYADQENPWRIKWRGKFLMVQSKKTAWKTEAAARSALRNHINYGNTPYFLAKENGLAQNLCHLGEYTKPYVTEAMRQLEAAGDIQFIKEQ